MKRVTIHQPNYLPWIGFFHKAMISDIFVILDDAQFTRGGYHNRCKILLPNGNESWLTNAVDKNPLGTPINEITRIVDEKCYSKLYQCYHSSPYWDEVWKVLGALIESNEPCLSVYNYHLIKAVLCVLGSEVELVLSSELNLAATDNSTEKLYGICKKLKASHYLSGSSGKRYLDESIFHDVRVEYQSLDFLMSIEYHQINVKDGFVQGLSIMDMLLSIGIEKTQIYFQNFIK